MESVDQKNYKLIKTTEFKKWLKTLSKYHKEKINELLICGEDIQEYINNNTLKN